MTAACDFTSFENVGHEANRNCRGIKPGTRALKPPALLMARSCPQAAPLIRRDVKHFLVFCTAESQVDEHVFPSNRPSQVWLQYSYWPSSLSVGCKGGQGLRRQ